MTAELLEDNVYAVEARGIHKSFDGRSLASSHDSERTEPSPRRN